MESLFTTTMIVDFPCDIGNPSISPLKYPPILGLELAVAGVDRQETFVPPCAADILHILE